MISSIHTSLHFNRWVLPKRLHCSWFVPTNWIKQLVFFIVVCVLSFAELGATDDSISEKRIGVALRMIGHEVLVCLGDHTSRVMPIEKIDDQLKSNTYRISFEFEFGFDPEDIVTIIDRVMKENEIATNYLVEVEQCESKDVVHSFEVQSDANSVLIACKGRVLPEDCYGILITISDGNGLGANSSQGESLTSLKFTESNLFTSVILIVTTLFLIGFIGYLIKKKNPVDSDPNLISIGAAQFDKRNKELSFEDQRVELSHKEAELLSLLHTSANTPLEREVILHRVWGDEGAYVGRTLDVFISKLRKKLEADPSVKIENIRGVGYKLVMDIPR